MGENSCRSGSRILSWVRHGGDGQIPRLASAPGDAAAAASASVAVPVNAAVAFTVTRLRAVRFTVDAVDAAKRFDGAAGYAWPAARYKLATLENLLL